MWVDAVAANMQAFARLASAVPSAARQLGVAARRHMSIHTMTRLRVACNSGAKEIQCIGHVR